MSRKHLKILLLLIVGALLLALSATSFAGSLGDVADNVSKDANKMGIALQVLGRLLGLGLVFTGLFMHYKAHKDAGQGRSSHSMAIVSWLVGAAFFAATSVIQTTGSTLWGASGGDQTTIQVNQ